jgi:hypothetical protein
MPSEYYKNKINEAHEHLNQGDMEGAIDILHNLKIRIHDVIAYQKAVEKEKQIDEKYKQEYKDETDKYGDPLERFAKASDFLSKLEKWRVSETLKFYDYLGKEYDI